MKSAPGVSLNMNDDVPKADSLRCLWLSSDIFKVHGRNEGTLILPSPPSLLPPRTIARQVNKLFIHVQRGTYDAALQLPCLSRSEVESYTSKKGKACCHSLRWPLHRAGRRSQYVGMFEHKNAETRFSDFTSYHFVRLFVRAPDNFSIFNARRRTFAFLDPRPLTFGWYGTEKFARRL